MDNKKDTLSSVEKQILKLSGDITRLSRQLNKQNEILNLYKHAYGNIVKSRNISTIKEFDRDFGFFNDILQTKGRPIHPHQIDVIRYSMDKHLRIIAGAGSGKTEAICAKAAYLIQMENIHPSRICMITHNSSAVNEVKRRVHQFLHVEESEIMFGTFNNIINHLINELNVKYPFFCLDPIDDGTIDFQNLIEGNGLTVLDDLGRQSLTERLIFWLNNCYSSETIISFVSKHFDYLTSRGHPKISDRCRNLIRNLKHPINNFCMFINQSLEIREFTQKRFDFIFIDEFQDITPLQMKIINIICPPKKNNGTKLIVVGDDDQALYSKQGSDPILLQNFDQLYDSKTMVLMVNYRCKYNIVQASNRLISFNKPNRIDKVMQPGQSYNGDIFIYSAPSPSEEAYWIYNQLKTVSLKEKTSIQNILSSSAVLYRSVSQLQHFIPILREYNIPYNIYDKNDRLGVFGLPKFKEIFLSWYSLFNHPNKWDQVFERLAINLYLDPYKSDFLINGYIDAYKGLDLFLGFLKDNNTLPFFIELSRNYIESLCYILETNSGFSNLGKLIPSFPAIKDTLSYYDINWISKTLSVCKNWIDLEGLYNEKINTSNDFFSNSLPILPISSARGLAFDHVFIIGTYEGGLPSHLSVSMFQIENELFKERGEPITNIEDERRQLYIALTRARKNVYITFPDKIDNRFVARSPFLKELRVPFVKGE